MNRLYTYCILVSSVIVACTNNVWAVPVYVLVKISGPNAHFVQNKQDHLKNILSGMTGFQGTTINLPPRGPITHKNESVNTLFDTILDNTRNGFVQTGDHILDVRQGINFNVQDFTTKVPHVTIVGPIEMPLADASQFAYNVRDLAKRSYAPTIVFDKIGIISAFAALFGTEVHGNMLQQFTNAITSDPIFKTHVGHSCPNVYNATDPKSLHTSLGSFSFADISWKHGLDSHDVAEAKKRNRSVLTHIMQQPFDRFVHNFKTHAPSSIILQDVEVVYADADGQYHILAEGQFSSGAAAHSGAVAAIPIVKKPTQQEKDTFVAAAHRGDLQKVKHFVYMYPTYVNTSDSNGYRALISAAGAGHVDVVRYLLKHSADKNKRSKITGKTAADVSSNKRQGYYPQIYRLVR